MESLDNNPGGATSGAQREEEETEAPNREDEDDSPSSYFHWNCEYCREETDWREACEDAGVPYSVSATPTDDEEDEGTGAHDEDEEDFCDTSLMVAKERDRVKGGFLRRPSPSKTCSSPSTPMRSSSSTASTSSASGSSTASSTAAPTTSSPGIGIFGRSRKFSSPFRSKSKVAAGGAKVKKAGRVPYAALTASNSIQAFEAAARQREIAEAMSREELVKLYMMKLEEEANYFKAPSPVEEEFCDCPKCQAYYIKYYARYLEEYEARQNRLTGQGKTGLTPEDIYGSDLHSSLLMDDVLSNGNNFCAIM